MYGIISKYILVILTIAAIVITCTLSMEEIVHYTVKSDNKAYYYTTTINDASMNTDGNRLNRKLKPKPIIKYSPSINSKLGNKQKRSVNKGIYSRAFDTVKPIMNSYLKESQDKFKHNVKPPIAINSDLNAPNQNEHNTNYEYTNNNYQRIQDTFRQNHYIKHHNNIENIDSSNFSDEVSMSGDLNSHSFAPDGSGRRVKRAIETVGSDLSVSEAQEVLDFHNTLRGVQGAADIEYMVNIP